MPNNYDEVVKKNKKYLTNAQVKALATASKQYEAANAGSRAGALSEARQQYDTGYRGLQNMGLAGNPNAAPASGEVPRLQTQIKTPLESFNQRLRQVENQRLSALGAAYKKQTIAVRAAAYAARQKQLAQQQAAVDQAKASINAITAVTNATKLQAEQQMKATVKAKTAAPVAVAASAAKFAAGIEQQNKELDRLRAAAQVLGTKVDNAFTQAAEKNLQQQSTKATGKANITKGNLNQKTGDMHTIDDNREAQKAQTEAAKAKQALTEFTNKNNYGYDADANKREYEAAQKRVNDLMAQNKSSYAANSPEIRQAIQARDIAKLKMEDPLLYASYVVIEDPKSDMATRQKAADNIMQTYDITKQADTRSDEEYAADKKKEKKVAFWLSVLNDKDADADQKKAAEKGLKSYDLTPAEAKEFVDQQAQARTKNAEYEYYKNAMMNSLTYAGKKPAQPVNEEETDQLYRAVNQLAKEVDYNDPYLRDDIPLEEIQVGETYVDNRLKYLTEDEINAYNYIYETEGLKAANQYIKDNEAMRNVRAAAEGDKRAKELVNKNFGTRLGANLMSIAANTIGNVPAMVEKLVTGAYNIVGDNMGNRNALWIDTSDRTHEMANFANAIRSETSRRILENNPGTSGQVYNFLYQGGMSMADSAVAMGFAYCGAPTMVDVMFFSSAGNEAYKDAMERGASQEQALAAGVLSGAAEAIFEHASIENFLNLDYQGKGRFIRNMLSQAGVEGSEEFNTEIANILTDAFIMEDKSSFNLEVQELMKSGMSKEDAECKALVGQVKNVGMAALGGFASGLGFGVFGAVPNAASQISTGREAKRTGVLDNYIQRAALLGGDAQRMANEVKESSKVSDRLAGALVQTVNKQVQESIASEGEEASPEKGAAMQTIMTGDKLTTNGAKSIMDTLGADAVKELGYDTSSPSAFAKSYNERLTEYGVAPKAQAPVSEARQMARGYADTRRDIMTHATISETARAKMRQGVVDVQATAAKADSANRVWANPSQGLQFATAEGRTVTPLPGNMTAVARAEQERTGFKARTEATKGKVTYAVAGMEARAGLTNEQKYEEIQKGLTKEARQKAKLYEALSEALGVKMIIHDVMTGTNGFIDENGNMHVVLSGKQSVLRVAAHELTHLMKDNNSAGYASMREHLIKEVGKERFDRLLKQKAKEYGIDTSTEKGRHVADDEVCAELCERMLSNEEALERFAEKDTAAAKTLKEHLLKLLNAIKQAFKRTENRDFGSSWSDLIKSQDTIESWIEGLQKAIENAEQRATTQESAEAETAKNGGVEYSLADNRSSRITKGMSDQQRAEELRNNSIYITTDTQSGHKLTADDYNAALSKKSSDVKKAVRDITGRLGLYSSDETGRPNGKTYRTVDIPVELQFSRSSTDESVQKFTDNTNREAFLKVLANLDKVVENAALIDVREDRYEGVLYRDHKYDNVWTLLSALSDGDSVYPVKIDIKQGRGDGNGNIYLVLDYGDIKIGALNAVGTSDLDVALAAPAPKVTIANVVSLVNSSDGDLLKYFPDDLLNSEQLLSKKESLNREADYTIDKIAEAISREKNASEREWLEQNKRKLEANKGMFSLDTDYMRLAAKQKAGTLTGAEESSLRKMVDDAAKAAGYTPVTRYHQTRELFNSFSTDNPVAGLYDSETPNGIFLKTNDHDIGIGGSIQMPLYLSGKNMLHFANREQANAWYSKNVPGYAELQAEMKKELGKFDKQLNDIEDKMFAASTSDEEYEALDEEWNQKLESMKPVENEYRGRLRGLLNDYFLNGNSEYDGIELDYDGHRWVDGKRENVHTLIAFTPSQVKSADTVTYDDGGNVIPLSERFNTANSDIRFSIDNPDALRIKEQIKQNQDKLNAMDPVAYIKSEGRIGRNASQMRNALLEFFGSRKYSVDRQGLGVVLFNADALHEMAKYIKTDAEFAAVKAAPAVVKRGIQIGYESNHKGRGIQSFTFAAPAVINGKRGNVAVVVQVTNKNKAHCVRILMPDGTGFNLDALEKADQNARGAGLLQAQQQMKSASNGMIADASQKSNTPGPFSLDTDTLREAFTTIDRTAVDKGLEQLKNLTPGTGLWALKDISRFLDGVSGGDKDLRNTLHDIFEKPHSEATGRYANGVARMQQRVMDIARRAGVVDDKGKHFDSKKSAAIQNIGEGFSNTWTDLKVKVYDAEHVTVQAYDPDTGKLCVSEKDYTLQELRKAYGTNNADRVWDDVFKQAETAQETGGQAGWIDEKVNTRPYTLADLQTAFPNDWQKLERAANEFRDMYDEYIRDQNNMLSTIYPIESEYESVDKLQEGIEKKEKRLADHKAASADRLAALREKLAAKEAEIAGKKRTDTKAYQQLAEQANRIRDQIETAQAEIQEYEAHVREELAKMNALKAEIQNEISHGDGDSLKRMHRLQYRSDYFHHFQEMTNGIQNLKAIFTDHSDIAPAIVGKSDQTKAKTKFAGFFQKREGANYTADAINGMLRYGQMAEYKLAFDPLAAYLRDVTKQIRELDKSETNRDNLIRYIEQWTNAILGKSHTIDRAIIDSGFGFRSKVFKTMDWINSRVIQNTLLWNMRSALVQASNMTNAKGIVTSNLDWMNGLRSWALARKGDEAMSSIMSQSNFLASRYMDNLQLTDSKLKSAKAFAGWLLGALDEFSCKATWWAAYTQYNRNPNAATIKKQNRTYESAVDYADDVCRRTHAGRGVGELAPAMTSRVVNLVAPFQVEVNNTWQLLKDNVKQRNYLGLLSTGVSVFVFNTIFEAIVGSTPLGFDFMRAVFDIVMGFVNDDPDDDDDDYGVTQISQRLAGELAGGLPFASQLVGIVGQDLAKKILGEDTDVTRYGNTQIGLSAVENTFAGLKDLGDSALKGKNLITETNFIADIDDLLSIIMPMGGKQLARTAEGIRTVAQGYSSKVDKEGNEKIQFITDSDIGHMIQAVLFGKWSLTEASEYFGEKRIIPSLIGAYDGPKSSLGKTVDAKEYKAALETGIDGRQFFGLKEDLKPYGSVTGKRAEMMQQDFTPEQKAKLDVLLFTGKDVETKAEGAVVYQKNSDGEWKVKADYSNQDMFDLSTKGDKTYTGTLEAMDKTGLPQDQAALAADMWDQTKNTADRKAEFRKLLRDNPNLSVEQKEALDRQYIGNKTVADYSDPELYDLSASDRTQYEKAKEAKSKGVSVKTFTGLYEKQKSYTGDNRAAYMRREIMNSDLTPKQKAQLDDLLVSDKGFNPDYSSNAWFEVSMLGKSQYEEAKKGAEIGLKPEVYLEAYKKSKTINGKDENGKTRRNLKKKRVKEYLDSLPISAPVYSYLYTVVFNC